MQNVSILEKQSAPLEKKRITRDKQKHATTFSSYALRRSQMLTGERPYRFTDVQTGLGISNFITGHVRSHIRQDDICLVSEWKVYISGLWLGHIGLDRS